MGVNFHEDAYTEMVDASKYYEERASGLGMSFLDSVEEAVDQVMANPESYILVSDEVRQKLLRRFPYSVLYVIEPDNLRIIAIAHQKRRPGYWHYRL
ncbi:MAG: type II toxin-antitoxin system RelE/ParE family toxin [Deltaproteobacteria bacterium]|nr:type II toxin-antitoxin system RelE/ParE family toxin [Deltaproteobacteria bacterium]